MLLVLLFLPLLTLGDEHSNHDITDSVGIGFEKGEEELVGATAAVSSTPPNKALRESDEVDDLLG